MLPFPFLFGLLSIGSLSVRLRHQKGPRHDDVVTYTLPNKLMTLVATP